MRFNVSAQAKVGVAAFPRVDAGPCSATWAPTARCTYARRGLRRSCTGFGLGGSNDLTTGSPRACVDLPPSLLPGDAVLSAFAPNGNPKFCPAL